MKESIGHAVKAGKEIKESIKKYYAHSSNGSG
jgi:hypothetical protein